MFFDKRTNLSSLIWFPVKNAWFSYFMFKSLFKHVTNNSSEPVFHSELEDEISPLSTLSSKLETLFLLSLLEICIS